MNKKYLIFGGIVVVGYFLAKGNGKTTSTATTPTQTSNAGFNLQPDFGVSDPTNWDGAHSAPGTGNGAIVGSVADIGDDFKNPTSLSALGSASP